MTIAILDFGSQYTQLIARRVRELQVYCELFPWDAPAEQVLAHRAERLHPLRRPSTRSMSRARPSYRTTCSNPACPSWASATACSCSPTPWAGRWPPPAQREYGPAEIAAAACQPARCPPAAHQVWMSHGDRIDAAAAGFRRAGQISGNSPFAAMGDCDARILRRAVPPRGAPHPERHGDPAPLRGRDLRRAARTGRPPRSSTQSVEPHPRAGGRRSACWRPSAAAWIRSVATALVHKAIGDQLVAVFVDTGLLRQDEREQVATAFRDNAGRRAGHGGRRRRILRRARRA